MVTRDGAPIGPQVGLQDDATGPPPGRVGLSRLLAPRSVVVVGATDRPGSAAAATLRNLRRAGFGGALAGVHPRHRDVLGVPCRPDLNGALELLGGPADAVVIATTTATVPDYLAESGRLGCAGAVVFTGGFADSGDSGAQHRLVAAARAHRLAVLGPNCAGLVSARSRAPLWTEPVNLPVNLPVSTDTPAAPGGGIALITETAGAGLLALAHRKAIGLHTVVSTGGAAVTTTPDLLEDLADLDGVRAIALYLERIPDGARLAEALARCARADVRTAVLRTGRHRSPDPALDALLAEAGAVPCRDLHQLVETARALSLGRRTTRAAAVVTSCSGDADLVADLAHDAGARLAELAPGTVAELTELTDRLPGAVAVANPLDHTTALWAQTHTLSAITSGLAADPQVGTVMYVQDEPDGLHPHDRADWLATRTGVARGAAAQDAGFLLVAGMPGQEPPTAVSGLSAALSALAQLQRPAPDPRRLHRIAAVARRVAPQGPGARTGPDAPGPAPREHPDEPAAGRYLAEHQVKSLLDEVGVEVLRHAVVPVPQDTPDPAVVGAAVTVAAEQIGFPVTVRLSCPDVRVAAGSAHLPGPDRVATRVAGLLGVTAALGRQTRCETALLIEGLPRPGVGLTMTVHREGVVPALRIGLGQTWSQIVTETRTVLLPADPDRIARAVADLPGSGTAELEAVNRVGDRLARLFVDSGLDLIGVILSGRTVVRAQARRLLPRPTGTRPTGTRPTGI